MRDGHVVAAAIAWWRRVGKGGREPQKKVAGTEVRAVSPDFSHEPTELIALDTLTAEADSGAGA